MRRPNAMFEGGLGLILLMATVLIMNLLAGRWSLRADLTEDRIFSLSPGTVRILAKMERDTTIKLFFSRSVKDLPPFVKTYATRVEETLNEYQAKSHGRIKVELKDPKPDTDDEESAQKYGISAVNLPRGETMYFGIVMQAGVRDAVIPYLDPRREEFLEYDLSSALVSLGQKERPRIGLMSSLPMWGGDSFPRRPGDDPWAVTEELRRNFNVEKIPLDTKSINQDLRTLVLVHPKNLSDETLYAIDQFVMGGGRLIVAVDPMSRTELMTSERGALSAGQLPQVSSDMTRLFAAWGVDYNPNQVVFDASFATPINAGGSVVPHPVFLSLSGAVFAGNSPVSSTLRQMLIGEAGALAAKEGQGFTFEPLITTSSDSGTITAENAMVMMPQDLMRDMKPDGKGRVLAALVRGTFKSAFEERPGDKTKGEEKAKHKDKDKDKDKDEKEAGATHRGSCTGECQMIVIADTDFLSNDSSVDTFRFGSQTLYRPRNDNLNFLYNAVDYLGGSDDLVAIRAKGRLARPFTRVLELQKSAQIKWQAEEERLTQELNELQKRLSELQAQRKDGGDNQSIATAQQDEITRFRDEERRVRGKRREVRKNLREDIEALGRKLIAWNMLGMPTMTSVLGAWVFFKRSRSRREVASTHERDKPSSP